MRFLWKLLAAVFTVAGIRAALAGGLAKPVDWKARVDDLVRLAEQKKQIIGLVVGISTADGQRLSFRYGVTKADGAAPDENTIFEIGSIGKPMTALLLALMAMSDEVKLDDPVQNYLPRDMVLPRRGKREITLVELATHTSGLPGIPPNLGRTSKDPDPFGAYDAGKLAQGFRDLKLADDPMPKWAYSNWGYGLLGEALAHKAGMSFEDLFLTRIAKPFGMKRTFVHVKDAYRAEMATGHDRNGQPTAFWTFPTLAGCGGIRSSAADMLTFLEFENGRRPSEIGKALELSQTPRAASLPDADIALGWNLWKTQPRTWFHAGGTGGFTSFAAFSREPAVAVIVLSNRSYEGQKERPPYQVAQELIRQLIADGSPTPKR